MANKYNWVDDPCISGKSPCDTDILNENLMHIKYDVTDEIQKKADDAINEVANAVAVQRIYDCGISTDTKGFEIINKLAHSTFDKSKFEVVGNPTITDDGIASGFSSSNYIYIDLKSKLNGDFCINFPKFNLKSFTSSDSACGIIGYKQNQKAISSTVSSTGILSFTVSSDGVSNDILNFRSNANLISLNQNYYLRLFRISNTYKLEISKNGINYETLKTSISELAPYNGILGIGFNAWSDKPYDITQNGEFGLKSVTVWSGGVPVFNGNKTGLYVAKPDNYIVEGSPTITDDGVASGFSTSNYIKINHTNFVDKDFELSIKFTLNSIDNQGILQSKIGSHDVGFRIWVEANYIYTSLYGGGQNAWYASIAVPLVDTKYIYTLKKVGETYTEELIYNYKNITKLHTSNIIMDIDPEGIYLGRDFQRFLNGSIDLNAFKNYIYGNLVYQPCLKIPYIRANEHSRVVDVAYRDRVQDLYEQTGEALFYTIDEQNQNFTLPAGDIYGMITKNREILDIVYPIGRPMPEENNVLLDNEVWLEGATVNPIDYPKLFKVYGTKYGGDGITTFVLPDLRNRVLWGSPDGSNGYIEAQLPNIKGGSVLYSQNADGQLSGCFYSTRSSSNNTTRFPSNGRVYDALAAGINASLYNEIYSDDATTVQPPAFKVRWKTRFE